MAPATRWMMLFVVVACGLAADQGTKYWANTTLAKEPPVSLCGDTFRLQYALNPGGFLGLGGELSQKARQVLFVGLNALGLSILAVYLLSRSNLPWALFLGGSLILAGGLGNQIDRCLFDGYVVDFLNLGLGPLRTGIFNVADMAISGGALLWVYLACFTRSDETATSGETAAA